MKRIIFFTPIFIIGLYICSCSKPEKISTPVFEGKTTGLIIYPGHNRMQVKFTTENADFGFCRIFWNMNNSNDSITLAKEKNQDNSYSVIIDNLPEGRLQFLLTMFDQSGKASINSSRFECEIYGEKYITSLGNRTIKEKMFISRKIPWIEWSKPLANEVGLVVTYTDQQWNESKSEITQEESKTDLPSYKEGTPIIYHSKYLPEKNCLDTFYSQNVTIPPQIFFVSKPIKYIFEKSSLVEYIISQSVLDIHHDVSYSKMQYIDWQGKPLSVFILEIDISLENVTMGVLMPNDKTDFALQTVKEMAQHRENSGGKVIAAVNGDFFEWTGIPWGPVVIKGEIIKNYLSASGSYFGITNENKPTIGIFTSGTHLSGFKEMLGGGHWLVEHGVAGNWESNREPRTSVGFITGKSVYLVVVDGRNAGYSEGITLTDLALIMKSLGVDQAINLDGGGSSLMCINFDKDFKIVNRYSDTNPRAVANALAVIEK